MVVIMVWATRECRRGARPDARERKLLCNPSNLLSLCSQPRSCHSGRTWCRIRRPSHRWGRPNPQAAARGYIPIFVFLAYAAFLITGFGTTLGAWRPVPIYIFSALLLLTFQETIAAHRSHGRFVYTFVTSAFAVLFAGDAVFHPFTKGNFALSPYTYIVVFAEIGVVYLWEVVTRRMQHPDGLRGSLRSYTILAADFAGLAILPLWVRDPA